MLTYVYLVLGHFIFLYIFAIVHVLAALFLTISPFYNIFSSLSAVPYFYLMKEDTNILYFEKLNTYTYYNNICVIPKVRFVLIHNRIG